MDNFNYLMDHILYQIFKIIFKKSFKKPGEKTNNTSMKIFVNKIENRSASKTKPSYYLKLLTLETMKLPRITKSNIIYKTGENLSHQKITEVVLVHCNIVNKRYQQTSRVLHTSVRNEFLGQLLDISS